jgi:hypothetical protein
MVLGMCTGSRRYEVEQHLASPPLPLLLYRNQSPSDILPPSEGSHELTARRETLGEIGDRAPRGEETGAQSQEPVWTGSPG